MTKNKQMEDKIKQTLFIVKKIYNQLQLVTDFQNFCHR